MNRVDKLLYIGALGRRTKQDRETISQTRRGGQIEQYLNAVKRYGADTYPPPFPPFYSLYVEISAVNRMSVATVVPQSP